MVEPDNLESQSILDYILLHTGILWAGVTLTAEAYDLVMSKYIDEIDITIPIKEETNFSSELNSLELQEVKEDVNAIDEIVIGALDAPIISLVNKIIIKALLEKASDIHIEPLEDTLRVRFRKDGILHQDITLLPKRFTSAILARFKIISGLNITEKRMPQDGKIRRVFQDHKYDFRVSSIPTQFGEKIVLRILDSTSALIGLEKLVVEPKSLNLLRSMIQKPFGLVIVAGPTGSGKSTTLYASLKELNKADVNICTVEDPVEYSLPGIIQVQVLREKNVDFKHILRSFLRQDPDIIMVGEVRDTETAKMVISAALTGHMVLTTLHTNDAPGAIARLSEMDVEPYMVSGALLGVIAQRLVRKVCTKCKILYTPTSTELSLFGWSNLNPIYRANALTLDEMKRAKSKGILCSLCQGAGYKGRCGVYEVMEVNDSLQKLISSGVTTAVIRENAIAQGMITLLEYSKYLVEHYYTTLEEIDRVVV